jgi:ABC-type branched-subunit amino acid transport system ATPase component/branched-subunit amino acid ABC-type transport system permease component
MTQHLVFLLLGVSSGAVFAALALGLVLTYRSSGVLNFATGSIALLTAYTYGYLRQGKMLSLIPGTEDTYDIGGEMGLWPALALSLVIAGLMGLLLYGLIFRPLRNAPPVAKAVATLGVSVIITTGLTARLGTTGLAVDPIYPTDAWTLGDVRISQDRIWFAITIVAVTVVLTLLFKYTRFGLATRAAAESEKGAYVSGISPDRVAAANWVLSSVVAGLAGILIAPIVPLAPISYTLFIVPALAAAVVGQFQFMGLAVGAGLAIGMLQSEMTYLQSTYDWLPASGMSEMVPLVLVLLVLVVRARSLPSRGSIVLQTLGRAPRPRNLLVSAVPITLVAAAALVLLDDRWRGGLISSLIFGVIGLSLVVVTGYCGQVSLAQLTLAGVAGFSLGPLADDVGLPFPIAPIVAALIAMVLGVVVGLPALRIRGLTVAVVTFALAYSLEAFWFRNLDFIGSSSGIEIKPPKIFGYDLGVGTGADFPRIRFGLLCLGVLVAVGIGIALLRNSRLGSQMLAVRANEKSAGAAGIDVVRVKLAAFAIGAFIAGLGGSLLAYRQGTVTFESYTALGGLALFTTVYLAGITSVSGGVLAGVLATNGLVYVLTDEVFSTGIYYEVISGFLLILTVILNPEGIVGPGHQLLEARRSKGRGGLTGSVATGSVRRDRTPPVIPDDAPIVMSVEDLGVRYGGVVAVDGVTFGVRKGEILGLIGPNGAGKTTLMDAVSGFAPSTGSIHLGGADLNKLKPFRRVRAGLGRTFQAIELYDDLSVEENVVVGLTGMAGRDQTPSKQVLEETFALLGLTEVRDRPAGELSQGQRQLVSIARALAGKPDVLLLDEPAGGLDSTESLWLGDRLRDIRDSGVTILIVDHDMSLVLTLCDRVQVLNFGKVIASGSPSQIRADRAVAAAYLGSTHAEAAVL